MKKTREITDLGTAFITLSNVADKTEAVFVSQNNKKSSWGDYATYKAENLSFCVPSALSPSPTEFPEKIRVVSGKVIEIDD